jgi:hypothetical protein
MAMGIRRMAPAVIGLLMTGTVMLVPATAAAAVPPRGAPIVRTVADLIAMPVLTDIQDYRRGIRDGFLEGFRQGWDNCSQFGGFGANPFGGGFGGNPFGGGFGANPFGGGFGANPFGGGFGGSGFGFNQVNLDYVRGYFNGFQRGFSQGSGACTSV